MTDDERELLQLSDVRVERVGLVRRGANRKPFFFCKSADFQESGGVSMSDTNDERQEVTREEALAALELNDADLEAFNTWRASQAEPEPEPEEGADEELPEMYAEKLAAMEEKFTAELKEATEAFAEERRLRRTAEFTDKVQGYSFGVEQEQFVADLMALEDYDAELYERWDRRLRAIDEQVKQGALFEQYSVGGGQTESGSAYLQEAERVRKEKFSDMGYHEGLNEAMQVVDREKPDLARRYAEGEV